MTPAEYRHRRSHINDRTFANTHYRQYWDHWETNLHPVPRGQHDHYAQALVDVSETHYPFERHPYVYALLNPDAITRFPGPDQ